MSAQEAKKRRTRYVNDIEKVTQSAAAAASSSPRGSSSSRSVSRTAEAGDAEHAGGARDPRSCAASSGAPGSLSCFSPEQASSRQPHVTSNADSSRKRALPGVGEEGHRHARVAPPARSASAASPRSSHAHLGGRVAPPPQSARSAPDAAPRRRAPPETQPTARPAAAAPPLAPAAPAEQQVAAAAAAAAAAASRNDAPSPTVVDSNLPQVLAFMHPRNYGRNDDFIELGASGLMREVYLDDDPSQALVAEREARTLDAGRMCLLLEQRGVAVGSPALATVPDFEDEARSPTPTRFDAATPVLFFTGMRAASPRIASPVARAPTPVGHAAAPGASSPVDDATPLWGNAPLHAPAVDLIPTEAYAEVCAAARSAGMRVAPCLASAFDTLAAVDSYTASAFAGSWFSTTGAQRHVLSASVRIHALFALEAFRSRGNDRMLHASSPELAHVADIASRLPEQSGDRAALEYVLFGAALQSKAAAVALFARCAVSVPLARVFASLLAFAPFYVNEVVEGLPSLLGFAARLGNAPLVEHLLDLHADVARCDARGRNAVHYAVEAGQPAMLEEFLRRSPASMHARTAEGVSPLHLAISLCRMYCIRVLLRHGANPFSREFAVGVVEEGPTAIDHASFLQRNNSTAALAVAWETIITLLHEAARTRWAGYMLPGEDVDSELESEDEMILLD